MAKGKKHKRLDAESDLALVYDAYKPELAGYIARRVDSAEEAEDILQDVFYNLARVDLLENPIEYLSAWLYNAASNRIIDRRRKKKEQALPEVREHDEDDYFLGALAGFLDEGGGDPESVFRNELIKAELEQALSELPDEQRAVFELTEYDGLSYREISESSGVAVATLLSRKHYAVNSLRRKLAWLYSDITEN